MNYIDSYELCLCGSGKKYKFCCYKNSDKTFHNSNEFANYIQKNKKKLVLCTCKNDECARKIINSHSIQNNKIISKLCDKTNHVYVIDYSNNSGIAGNNFMLRGKNEASTSKSFCEFHDDKIFKPIECNNYDNSLEQNFLYSYRAFAKHYYDMMDWLNTERLVFKTIPKSYSKIYSQVSYIHGLNKEVESHEKIKNIFNIALEKKNFNIISSYVIELDYEIQFATSYMAPLSYDLKGSMVSDLYSLKDDMRYIFVTIFPENKKSFIIISWLTEDEIYLKKFIEQIDYIKNKKNELINVLNNLIVSQTNNFVISPRLYDSWDKEKQKNFLEIYCATFFGSSNIRNLGQEIEKNLIVFPCKFDLFEELISDERL